jgi:pyruvate,water dikinase
MKTKYIVDLSEVQLSDLELVGGKNASLGEMIQNLGELGVSIPGGFALTIDAYWEFISFNKLDKTIRSLVKGMKKYGLERGKYGLQVYLMAELPSNILMAEEFSEHIDGFSIGSNDLTQLTLGLDRDSSLVAHIYDERNPAVKRSISNLIKVAKKTKTKVGICGQGPSDYPDFAQFLVEEGIDTISVTPDSMLKTIKAIHKIETKK